jgi:hypothetical protein
MVIGAALSEVPQGTGTFSSAQLMRLRSASAEMPETKGGLQVQVARQPSSTGNKTNVTNSTSKIKIKKLPPAAILCETCANFLQL